MRKIIYIVSTLLVLAGCHGYVDPTTIPDNGDEPVEIPDEYTAPFTLTADITEVEASGKDTVTFKLLDAYDRDLLIDEEALQNINIVSEEGQRVPRMSSKAVFIANGTYHFTARYMGKTSKVLKIKAKNRALYEKFHKNVAIYKATATWCGPCANMTKALASLNEDTKNHSVELCWHYQDELAITAPGYNNDCGTVIASRWGEGGVPTVVMDLMDYVPEKSASALEASIWNLRAEYPATCGIKVATEYDNGVLNINAELNSATGGEYDLGFAVLLNDQVFPGGTNEGGRYSHIVQAATGNFVMYSNAIQSVPKDGTMTRTQSVPVSDISDVSVAVFALVKEGEGARIDNIVEVKAGESVDYKYNTLVAEDDEDDPDDPDDPNGGNNGGNNGEGYPDVPEGVLRIFADKEKISADGNDAVTFTVMFGSENVSNAKTLQLIREFDGVEKYMAYGANKFSTVTPGTYKFTAKYYYAGNHYTDNEVEIVAEQYFTGEEKEYPRRYLGMLFTSTGCTYCPVTAKGLKELQAQYPGEISAAAFHSHFSNFADPMTVPATGDFNSALGGFTGLPTFFWNMNKDSEVNGSANVGILKESLESEKLAYETYSGVAIGTSYNESTRELSVEASVVSNKPSSFRALILLVEDNIHAVGDYEQQSNSNLGDYYHNNVVRCALTGVHGDKVNDGLPLTVGVESMITRTVTLDEGWNPENMRVIVAAMASDDSGYNWRANNVNECKIGEKVSFDGEVEESDPVTPNPPADVKYDRHVCLMEFTGAWCNNCPAGYKTMMGTLSKPSLKQYEDNIHLCAFHSNLEGEDPMAVSATQDIMKLFSDMAYPSFVTDLRVGGNLNEAGAGLLQPSIEASFNDYPAHCGVAVSSDVSSGKADVTVKVASQRTSDYRVLVLVVESRIKYPQKTPDYPDGDPTYIHNHVVRKVVTTYKNTFTGEKMADSAVINSGEEKSKTWSFDVDPDWNLDNTEIYAIVLDENGHVNNMNLCPIENGNADYDIL